MPTRRSRSRPSSGARAVFEPHAVVWAEEPGAIRALWKQRLRWARGNLQVTRQFWRVWFRPHAGHRLGSITFGLFWFSLLLQPAFMILASAALVTRYFVDQSLAWHAFHALRITNVLAYVFITTYALLIDPRTGRHVWREAVLFPGVISVVIMLAAIAPPPPTSGWSPGRPARFMTRSTAPFPTRKASRSRR